MGIDTLFTTKMLEEDLKLGDKGRLTHCENICFLWDIVAKLVCNVLDNRRRPLHEIGVLEDFWPRGPLMDD